MEDDALQASIDAITARLVRNQERLKHVISKDHERILVETISEDTRRLRELTERPVS